MCGICAIYSRRGVPIELPTIDAMTAVLRHRGPDGSGRFIDGQAGLGHVRLSIIDVEGGSQPIANETGSMQVVFNGEIYNFIELREQLEGLGHRFRTRSDTEVIVHAYEQWGTDCVRRFNGMFAFALWDAGKREMFIARDHLGIKPLYYADVGSRLLIASEIKALLQDSGCPREIDLEALSELFTFRYVPSPRTMFKGIFKLEPGHWMKVGSGGVEIKRFWNWVPSEHTRQSEGSLVEEYQDLLRDAVRLQLRSDVPLGLFLSSGIDSAALLAMMSEHSPEPVRAFTIGFEGGEDSNEVDDARRLARMFGARHEFLCVTAQDYQNYYERYLWDLEEPVGNETAAAFYFVSQITSRSVKVALTGQGADEPWAGYHRHIGAKLSALYGRMPERLTGGVAQLVGMIPGRFERLQRGATALGEPDVLTRFAKVYSFFSADMTRQLFRDDLTAYLAERRHESKDALLRLQSDVTDLDPLSQMLYIDTRASLPDDLLMVGDKMSMANSLEVRVPFLDYRVVEFIERLPPRLKLNGLTGKYLHKKALQKWLPNEVVWRKKKGFANPVEHWFRQRMKPFVEDCLLAPDAAVARYFDQSYIRRLLELDRLGKRQYRRHLYLLVSFELWHRRFLAA